LTETHPVVIAGLDPAIHLFQRRWMRGSSPRMTVVDSTNQKLALFHLKRRAGIQRQIRSVQLDSGFALSRDPE
jgi:hypothetical protein